MERYLISFVDDFGTTYYALVRDKDKLGDVFELRGCGFTEVKILASTDGEGRFKLIDSQEVLKPE